MWFWLPYMILLNASVFFARVKLEQNQIIVQESLTDTRRHRFIRILRYWVKPCGNKLDVELTVEQMWPPKSDLFGIEFSLRRKPPSIQERIFSFAVELNQAETLMNYLHAHGAVLDEVAAMWKQNDFSSCVSALTERDDLPEEETNEILLELEERSARLKKYNA